MKIILILLLASAFAAAGQPYVHPIGVVFYTDDGSELLAGKTVYYATPVGCTIQGWDMTIDAGTASIDVWKVPNRTPPPTYLNSITGGATPAVTGGGHHVYSANISGWKTAVSPHDMFGFYLKVASGGTTQASLVLQCQ